MSNFIINGNIINEINKPYLIAEVGINHNGKLENAIKMIEIAKDSGVNCVKFQTFKAEEFIIDKNLRYSYHNNGKEINESMQEMFKRYEFKQEEWYRIKEKCLELEIEFLSTPQNPTDMDFLNKLGVNAIKIGSDDFNNIPLIKYYASFNKPIILSTGMANYNDVTMVVDLFKKLNFKKYSLLVCTSAYPAPLNEVNLNKILTLKTITKNKIIGFSDHTENNYSSMIAVGLGARIFEKHFTLDKNFSGPDHRFSMNPEELKDWVNSINLSFSILGTKEIVPTNKEIEMLKIARRSITAIKQIKKGEIFTIENIGLRRPSDGLPPSKFESILNNKAKRNYNIGEKISEKDF